MAGLVNIPSSPPLTNLMNNNITFSLLEKIESVNKDYSLFDSCKKLLVGLSGGADSTCLTCALHSLSEKYGFKLYAVHVNHMIRGEEAYRDEDFARNLCSKLGIDFICKRIDIPALCSKTGKSTELCARDERYSTFIKTAKEYGISHVATAHNSGDNAETVLFNLIRGSGSKGLCGIPAKRNLADGITLIRPLITSDRDEIISYLSQTGQDFVTDSTNSDTDYTRNLIRNNVMPFLLEINPALNESIGRTGKLLRKDEDFLLSLAKKNISDELSKLCVLDECILTRVLRIMFQSVSDEMPEEKHIYALCEKIYAFRHDPHLKCSLSFPDKISAVISKGKLTFEKNNGSEDFSTVPYSITLEEGINILGNSGFALYLSYNNDNDIPQVIADGNILFKKVSVDCLYTDTSSHCLIARTRKDGDKIRINGMNKSLKRIMNEKEIDEKIRFSLPLICEKDNVIYVSYIGCSDEYRNRKDKQFSFSVALYRA